MSGRNVDSRLVLNSETESLSVGNNGQPEKQPPDQQHTSWYENIQFKAQYHHLRTNNYAAIVKSAHSLDKVTTLPTVTVTSPQPPTKAHHKHGYYGRRDGEREPESPPDGAQSFCWNFPRVTLRSLFNTKSLDDILGRTGGGTGPGHGGSSSSPQKSPSSRRSVPNTSAQFLQPPPVSRPRSSSTESTVRIYHPSSETGGHGPENPQVPIQSSLLLSHSKSATDIQIEHRAYRYNFPSGPQVVPLSASSSDTNCSIPSNKPIPRRAQREAEPHRCPDPTKTLPLNPILSPGRDATLGDDEKMKRNNKVEPTTPTSTSGTSSGTTERKLVVTSLSYLQRPSSPISPGGSPASTPVGGPGPPFPPPTNQEVPMSRQPKSSRFFPTCCGSGSGKEVIQVAPLPPPLNNESTKGRGTGGKGVIPILKNVEPLRNTATCSTSADSTRNQNQERSRVLGTQSGTEEMADLQSPHYVKRTAHMFQSKFISSPQSPACSPSYLNVSRSVSGYSCLSYGTPNVNTNGGHTTNGHGGGGVGISGQNGHTSRTAFRTTRSALRHHSSSFPSQSPVRGGTSRHHSADLSPPPLPKSAPPLASPALVGQQRTNNNNTNTNGRSLILEKIERLYGQSEVESSSSLLWKRRTPPPEGTSPPERIIPIRLDTDTDRDRDRTPTGEIVHHVIVQDQESAEQEDQVDRRYYADEGDKIGLTSTSTKEGILPPQWTTVVEKTSTEQDLSGVPILLPPHPVTVSLPLVPQPTMAPTRLNKENESRSTKDGEFFLRELEREKEKIERRIEAGGAELEACEDPSGEESGRIRAAIGKARLLINKKFKQFEGLCHTNLEQTRYGVPVDEPFPTKNEDLDGFWDMVLIQVDHIHEIFDELDPNHTKKLDDSDKKCVLKKSVSSNKPTGSKIPKATKPMSGAANVTNLRDENRRKMLAEKRKAMKVGQSPTGEAKGSPTTTPDKTRHDPESLDEIQIFTPEQK